MSLSHSLSLLITQGKLKHLQSHLSWKSPSLLLIFILSLQKKENMWSTVELLVLCKYLIVIVFNLVENMNNNKKYKIFISFIHSLSIHLISKYYLLISPCTCCCAVQVVPWLATSGQQCPVDIPETERRDCYPWIDADQDKCEARGCVWCETSTEGIPFCFYDDTVKIYLFYYLHLNEFGNIIYKKLDIFY